jgi:hypothetical protein
MKSASYELRNKSERRGAKFVLMGVTVQQLTFYDFINKCLTILSGWSGKRSIYTDQFAIPVLQLLNKFHS